MKKSLILITIISLVSFNEALAQDDSSSVTTDSNNIEKNELKINALFLVVGSINVTYERLLNQESGLGIEVFVPYDSDIKESINYYVSPYYRFYFGNKYASGFFLEGFGMLNSLNEEVYDDSQLPFDGPLIIREESTTDFALGIGLGGKWITNSGFIGELNFGIGRNLFGEDTNDDGFVGKFGIAVGYRF